jgi:two-component system cell cycle sensor histidine kinase/response regulator CckA
VGDESGARRDVGVCLLDASGVILELDTDFGRLVSLPWPAAARGRPLAQVLPSAPPLAKDEPTRAWHPEGNDVVELICRAVNLTPVAYTLTARLVRRESALASQLRVARQTLDSVIEASPLAITTLDHNKRVVMWNTAAERMFGWSQEEILGEPYPLVPKDELPSFERLFTQVVLEGEGFTAIDSIRQRKDGSHVEVRMHTAPLRDADGRVTGGMALLEDLTETRALEDRIRHSQKMEAVGRLAGGIAHDFNNLLTVIVGMGDLLALDDSLSPSAHEHVAEILDVVDSARELVTQLMTFSRRSVVRPKVLDLNERVREAGKMLRRLLGEEIELQLELDSVRAWVRLDPTQFDQVLLNLAVNAADAMPQGGRLRYSSALETHDHTGPLAPGTYVRLEVSDTGTGIPADVLPRIFDPFFTTKATGEGTGLGLANVYGIVRQASGDIEVDSREGEGTRFVIRLPLAARPQDAGGAKQDRAALPGGSERLLLVEDNEQVRMSTAKLLSSLGYRVETACNGAEALELIWNGLEVELVLTDLAMPEVSGAELAEQLARHKPALPIIFMSGNLDVEALRVRVEQGKARFLQKPVTLRELAQTTREALDKLGARGS